MKYLISAIVEAEDMDDVAAYCDLIPDIPSYGGPVVVEFIDFDEYEVD